MSRTTPFRIGDGSVGHTADKPGGASYVGEALVAFTSATAANRGMAGYGAMAGSDLCAEYGLGVNGLPEVAGSNPVAPTIAVVLD